MKEKKTNFKEFICSIFGHKWKRVSNDEYRVHIFICSRCGETQKIKQ